jgi:hypothetical protein
MPTALGFSDSEQRQPLGNTGVPQCVQYLTNAILVKNKILVSTFQSHSSYNTAFSLFLGVSGNRGNV